MNAVGIDVSKGKSMVAVLRSMGELVTLPYEVAHTEVELERLAYSLKELEGETRVVLEHTGRYYEPVAQTLHDVGLFVSAVNPLLIKEFGNNSLRKVKTDKKDALKIAKYGLDNWVALREYVPMETARQQLKNLASQHELYIKLKVSLKNSLIDLIDQTYSGANTFFDSPVKPDGHQKWVDFVTTFWHADCVSGMSEPAFIERYRKWCKRHGYNFSEEKAADVYISSLGHITMLPKSANTKLLVGEAAAALTAISRTAETFSTEMHRLAQTLPEYSVVMEMYGVGKATGPKLMAEIGDVRRFAHRGAVVAYAGVDPQPSQSGKHNSKSNPISRKGSSSLRKTLYQVMTTLLRKMPADEPVYQFIDKKRGEGKPYFVYMMAGANKFLRIYYARVKEHLDAIEKLNEM